MFVPPAADEAEGAPADGAGERFTVSTVPVPVR
jgi:hypothetical protein